MADPFVFNELTPTAVTGTAATTLLSTAAVIPSAAMADPGTEFNGLLSARYHNNTGARRDVNLDLVANGNLIYRSSLFSLAASSSFDRTISAYYSVIIQSASTAMVVAHAHASAAGTTGEDVRNVSPTWVDQTFDTSAPLTLDVQATLSTVSNLTTHSLTLNYFRLNTLGIFSITTDGGGGGGGTTLPFASQLPYVCLWGGSAYNTRPALPFNAVFYFGPVEPNGVNSPGGPSTLDTWIDTSGA